MKKDNVIQFNLSDETLVDFAENKFQNGDYFGALTMLNKRGGMYDPSADAQALYADIYEALELYDLAADAWFRFLDVCNEADFREGYEGLYIAFSNMNNEMQAAYYRGKMYAAGEDVIDADIDLISLFQEVAEETKRPKLRLIHSVDGTHGNPEALSEGVMLLKEGKLEESREAFYEIPEASPDYASSMGLAAMCTLMMGDEEGAENECKKLLERFPDNVQALTTYCAVLGARDNKTGAKEVAKRLSLLKVDSTEDMYRVATALCETGLDEEAYDTLTVLKGRLPYDENVLYFHAVAAFHTGKTEEAIDSLERLTTLYPRKAVAKYYLERLRTVRDGDTAPLKMTYYYRVPEEEYRAVADFFLAANNTDHPEALSRLDSINEFYRIAFDELEGRDEKLQMIAAKVAVKARSDRFVREVLLNYEGDEIIKLSLLHDLTMRNEEDSFGVVICNLYKEFFTHKIEIGDYKYDEFMKAFSDVYAKFALLSEDNEGKICAAAEDIYATLEEAEALIYAEERAALAAAIYREARLLHSERSMEEIAKMFDANRLTVQKILNYMM